MARLTWFAAAVCWISLASAQDSAIGIGAQVLRVGARSSLSVDLALPADAAEPVLVTTSSEGSALEVVRGRFVRLDAADAHAQTLRFDVPVVARAAGTAIFRVQVLYYRCQQQKCVAIEQEAESLIEIAAAQ